MSVGRQLCARGCTYDDGTPRPAVPGSQVCTRDEHQLREGLREVGTLYALLADPRRGQAPRTGSRSSEQTQPISDDARRVRSDLRLALIQWCKILAEPQFGIGLPDERRIRATTVQMLRDSDDLVRAAGDQYQEAIDAARGRILAGEAPGVDLALAAARERYDAVRKRQRPVVAGLRDDIATDADLQAGLAEHIARQLSRLLADPDEAGEFAEQMLFLLGEARRLAYPGRRMTIACSCGGRVAVDADRLMVCPDCGQDGDVAWWQAQATAEQDARPLRLRELPDWLLLRGLVVGYEQVRSWADDGHLQHAYVDGPTPEAPSAPRRYDGPTVYLLAEHRLNGPRAATRS